MDFGIKAYPEWYPGLTVGSSFEAFQRSLHQGGHGPTQSGDANFAGCEEPCPEDPNAGGGHGAGRGVPAPTQHVLPRWQPSGEMAGAGWCQAEVPASDWHLRTQCEGNLKMKVMTYNLFWWNLFGVRQGNGGSAGKLIAGNGPYDIMAFQECGDAQRVLNDAGYGNKAYAIFDKGHGLAMAYNRSSWQEISGGSKLVAEDRYDQYYGTRAVSWVRLRHLESGRTVFFLNHHGPLPVNTGGRCGPKATAYALLRVAGTNAEPGDSVVLVGDLNADGASLTQRTLQGALHRVVDHWVDAIFDSCPGGVGRRLGTGGSDHEALEAVLRL